MRFGVIGVTGRRSKPAYPATSTLEVAMLARVRAIRFARRHAVEFRCSKTPREALAALPLCSPAEGLGGPCRQRQEADVQPGRDRLGLAH
jgi:hypothetical protein